MQKIINEPDRVVDEMLEGYVRAHADVVARTDNPRVLKYHRAPVKGKVGIVTGGGSGHKPAFIGYLGRAMCDAVAVGEIFTSPPAQMFYDAFRAADGGKGVACLFGNYAGDVMNVKMAVDMAADDGITVKTVIANDDVPSAPKAERAKRRGVAGEILMWKVARREGGHGRGARRGDRRRPHGDRQHPQHGHRALARAPSPPWGIPTSPSRKAPWRSASATTASPASRWCPSRPRPQMARRMTDIILPDLPFAGGRRGDGARLGPRLHAGERAVHPLPRGGGDPRREAHQDPATVRRQLLHLPRDGRRHPHDHEAGRRARGVHGPRGRLGGPPSVRG